MIQTLPRIITVLCVVFCCTARPAPARSSQNQTFSLNGLWADMVPPAGPVRLVPPIRKPPCTQRVT
jgi:hypothetical protein